jgi:hypothetical protein
LLLRSEIDGTFVCILKKKLAVDGRFKAMSGNLSSARFVGVQPGLVLDHIYSSHFSSTVGYFRFFTGDFLVQTPPGKNVGYLCALLTSLF